MSPTDPHEPSTFANWSPRDIAYDEAFENAVQEIFQDDPPSAHHAIAVLPDDSAVEPQPGVSMRARDIDQSSLPLLALADLPLPLQDSRRIYASPISGIRLTHPGGYLEGGPGAHADDRTFARDFIAHFNISDPEQLRHALHHQISQHIQLAKERMDARNDALQHNARVEKELKTLMDQRDMEVKIETRMKEEASRRRETKEKKKMPAV